LSVICDPEDEGLPVEMARRGFRLLLLHGGAFPVDALRRRLRDQGLASGLMGSHAYRAGVVPFLAADFYELWVFCGSPRPFLLQAAAGALKKGSPIFWKDEYPGPPEAPAVQSPPPGWRGCLA
jgi:hypothetical protein